MEKENLIYESDLPEKTPLLCTIELNGLNRFSVPPQTFEFVFYWYKGEAENAVDARAILITHVCRVRHQSGVQALIMVKTVLNDWLSGINENLPVVNSNYESWETIHGSAYFIESPIIASTNLLVCRFVLNPRIISPTLDLRQLDKGVVFLLAPRAPLAGLLPWLEALEEQLKMTIEQYAEYGLKPELVDKIDKELVQERLYIDETQVALFENQVEPLTLYFDQALTLPIWRHLYKNDAIVSVTGMPATENPSTTKLPPQFFFSKWRFEELTFQFYGAAARQREVIRKACELLDIRQMPWYDAMALLIVEKREPDFSENVLGFSYGPVIRIFAINPALYPTEFLPTALHEMAHILLGHLEPTAHNVEVEEFEAEAVTFLCINALLSYDESLFTDGTAHKYEEKGFYDYLYKLNGARKLTTEECARIHQRDDDIRACATLLINALLDRLFIKVGE